jgi:hypothetical protein
MQLRDELAQSTSDSPVALAERCKQLCREIMHEEQRAAQETAELAEEASAQTYPNNTNAICHIGIWMPAYHAYLDTN